MVDTAVGRGQGGEGSEGNKRAGPGDGQPARALRPAIALSGVAGLGLAVVLLIYSGVPAVLQVLALAGWSLAWIVPAHLVPIALDAVGWRALLAGERGAGRLFLTWVAALRDSINTLLPVARVGGEVAAVRLLALRGVSAVRGTASVIVEVTTTLFTQVLFALLGLAILVAAIHDSRTVRLVLVGLLASLAVAVLFLLVQQRWGLARLFERLLAAVAGRAVLGAVGDPAQLDGAVRELYRRPRAVAVCAAWQLAGLLAGAGELWLTLSLLGHRPSVAAAIAIESLTQAVQSASFFVPAGLGVQEGSFLVFGAATGFSPSVGLALALARRCRQLGFGLPCLISWQWLEGRRVRQSLARGT